MAVPAHMADQETTVGLMDTVWEKQQIRAFTAWCNSHLRKRNLKIENIQTDLSDGKLFLALMEIVGDVQLPKPARGKMRIHKIQNLNAALKYLSEKGIRLVGIGAEEIADENLKLILGTIWTIILRFDIQDISLEEMSAKDALLLWCQRKTNGYRDVHVSNFHMSWKDGMAFCALIHKHRPDLIDYDKLKKDDPVGNLRLALEVADKHLDVAPMIDPEEVAGCVKPDERSITTQVAAFYKCFASYNKNEVAASKIASVLRTNREHEKLIQEYETMASNLLEWIPKAIDSLSQRPLLSSVQQCLDTLKTFSAFRTQEYPAKVKEKAELEAHYSSLQMKLRLSGRPPYEPSEGKMIDQINEAWGGVDSADIANKKWTVEELRRNRDCEQKAAAFKAKADNHDNWVGDLVNELAEDDYSSSNLGAVNAMIKKHEAFGHELQAKETGVHEIGTLANELDDLKYVDAATINERYATIYDTWEKIRTLTEERTAKLNEAAEKQQKLESLWVEIAKYGAPLNSDLDEFIDRLNAAVFSDSLNEVQALQAAHDELKNTLIPSFQEQYTKYSELVSQAAQLAPLSASPSKKRSSVTVAGDNPYAVHSKDELDGKWQQVQTLITQREETLAAEQTKQEQREQLRVKFAQDAASMQEVYKGFQERLKEVESGKNAAELEKQAEMLEGIRTDVVSKADGLNSLESTAKEMDDALIFDNEHTSLTIEMVRGMQQNIEVHMSVVGTNIQNQILTRDSNNITDEQMQEFRQSFDHFDKDKSGQLDRLEFRGCLLSLGIDIPQVATGDDAEFNRILTRVDPNQDGHISFTEFVAFMAEERADAANKDDLLEQFTTLAGGQPYILPSQLSDLDADLVEFCMQSMAPYEGGPEGALDYQSFAAAAFGEGAEI
eukprot:m.331716 g.331716  ORF g.331716 m.331716 type:complete len:894 (+) comp16784_c0_seq1:77-2758(+)